MIAWVRHLAGSVAGEWLHIARNGSVLLILLGLPLFYPTVVSWLYQPNLATERPALLIDDDNSALSREFTRNLDATMEVRLTGRPASLEEGFAAIREGLAELMIYIPPDFSRKIKRDEPAEVKLWINTANMLTYAVSYPGVSNVIADMTYQIALHTFRQRGAARETAENRALPLVRFDRFLFHPTGAYGDFFTIGVFLVVVQQITLIGLAFSMGLRREKEPRLLAGRFPATTVFGRGLAQTIFYLLGSAFILYFICPRFGWPMTDAGAIFALFAAFCVAMLPLSALVASLVRDRYESFQLLMFASTPLFMMSGFTWPFDQMPEYVQRFASAFPLTPALQALRILSMKSAEPALVHPYLEWMAGQFCAWSIAFWLTMQVLTWREKRMEPSPPAVSSPADLGGGTLSNDSVGSPASSTKTV